MLNMKDVTDFVAKNLNLCKIERCGCFDLKKNHLLILYFACDNVNTCGHCLVCFINFIFKLLVLNITFLNVLYQKFKK